MKTNKNQLNPLLEFKTQTGKAKTKAIDHQCPFCDVTHLNGIIARQHQMILLKNKYSTLADTDQLVLIESANHNGDISNYQDDEWCQILAFAVEQWLKLLHSGNYQSVILHKNKGYLSGGTQKHPHMQILGFKKLNAYQQVNDPHYYAGLIIAVQNHVEFNLSTHPIMGLVELNIIWQKHDQLPTVARMIKTGVRYVLEHYYSHLCHDYNLFFYYLDNHFICKITPRFVVSSYFVGYQISQCLDKTSLQQQCATLKRMLLMSTTTD